MDKIERLELLKVGGFRLLNTLHTAARQGIVSKAGVLRALKDGTLKPGCSQRYGPWADSKAREWVGLPPAPPAMKRTSAPCCAGATYYEVGDKLKVYSLEWGHVFVYREGLNAPGMQCPCCVACGQPWHSIRDQQAITLP